MGFLIWARQWIWAVLDDGDHLVARVITPPSAEETTPQNSESDSLHLLACADTAMLQDVLQDVDAPGASVGYRATIWRPGAPEHASPTMAPGSRAAAGGEW